MDYFEGYVGYDCAGSVATQAEAQLWWSGPSQPKQIIPTPYLYPAGTTTTVDSSSTHRYLARA